MNTIYSAPNVPGAADVITWFGHWPTFHDAEVLSISLDRSGECRVAIHAFETTAKVDADGAYLIEKHAVVTFRMEGFPKDPYGITTIRLESFNEQNVLSSATLNKRPGGYELALEGCYGVNGLIIAERISIQLTPGILQDSVYRPPKP
jgi:hypothetical protein